MSAPRRYRLFLSLLVFVSLLAALFVGAVRERKEHGARRVELAMDYVDLHALAASYGYDEYALLLALRRAGLTSVAVAEELGSDVNDNGDAIVASGQQLMNQAKLARLTDPTLAVLARAGGLSPRDLYLIVEDRRALERYRSTLVMHLGAHAVRVVRAAPPTILAVRSQLDYFNSLGLGLPAGPLDLTRRLHLFLIPRVQNDERYRASDIDRIFASFFRNVWKPSTVVFFGQRNEVLGFPDHLDDTAAALQRTGLNFGSIEVYDKNQLQKGNDGLAQKAIERTTRVEAISKLELDKLDLPTVVARYLLGVRERNIRVVYLRPYLHALPGTSLESTNVELVKEIADGLRARAFKLGRATPVPDFRTNPLIVALVSLGVPAMFLLLLEAFGIRRAPIAYAAVLADLALLALGYAVHHDLFVRKLLALVGGIEFATMGVVAIPRAFTLEAPVELGAALAAGLRTVAISSAFALGGALSVVGLVSAPLLMEEIDRFSGVKAVIVLPPLLAFVLYVYTRRFGNDPPSLRSSALEPVRIYQLVALALLAAGAIVYVMRSGNQSEIAPSAFEVSLRSGLTSVLGVRPRFKEFLVGFPLMLLLPALRLEHKRLVGWLFAIGIAIGTSDIVDTFSHLHTPLFVSLVRVFNGALIGCIIGTLVVLAYRRFGLQPARRSDAAFAGGRAAFGTPPVGHETRGVSKRMT